MDVLQRSPDNGIEESSILETVNAVAAGKPLSCPNHDGNVMEFYCQSCETAMCQDCTGGEHAEHPTVPLKDVVEQHKAALQAQLDAVKKRYCKESFSCLLMYQHSLVNELWASVLK
ncbi:hypothetical protein AB205_0152240 [Aquarana catesbeiana]|uniref:B box-type domain-containing protein n=2 Tax=Aquarana catesbeiana TaxID=8400 RepID=A0A2G9QFM1_AQUCT|nr:hypothetical protein AB205_0152240 [Aquarana catesbeiana]